MQALAHSGGPSPGSTIRRFAIRHSLGIWVFGYLGIWVFGYLGIWVFGYLGIWVFGYLGIWAFASI